MSTPKHWHAWIHELPAVGRVSISNHDGECVVKHRYHSKVDIQADFCDPNLPVNPGTFDTVICASILEHCQAPAGMMQNLNRVLAEGGTLLLAVPFAGVDGHSQPDFWRFGQDGLTLLAEKAGFDQIQTGGLGEVGSMLDDILGSSNAANDHHRGLPLINWLIAAKPRVC
jgi:SAM-dependent methyltransferase